MWSLQTRIEKSFSLLVLDLVLVLKSEVSYYFWARTRDDDDSAQHGRHTQANSATEACSLSLQHVSCVQRNYKTVKTA